MGGNTEPRYEEQAEYPASGEAMYVIGHGYLRAWGTGVPTASATGYATGCIYHRLDGGDGTSLYVNEGDKDAATWQAFPA